jgi:LmbE family N-acetylglucosaminyl deacetylase
MAVKIPVRRATPAAEPRKKKAEPTVEEKWAAYQRALVVMAHPDDAEFLAGGTIAKLCDIGMDVTVCVATSGDKGTRDSSLRRQELAAIREAETRAAAKVLGVRNVVFWGLPDGFLVEDHDLRGMVVKLIRTLKPDLMMTWEGFRPSFNHTDHRVIGRVVRDALFPAAHDPHYYGEMTAAGIGPHRTAEVLLAGAHEPDFHVNIGPYLEKKADSILCHTSQIDGRTRDEILSGWLQAGKRNKERRKQTGYDHAESFRRIEFRRPAGAPGTPPASKKTAAARR